MSVVAQAFALQVLEALGLPAERCAGFSIHFEPNEVVSVEARYYPDNGALAELTTIVTTLKPAP